MSEGSEDGRSEQEPVVCVIDDDAFVRQGLSNLLRSVGLRVLVYGSADEFLRAGPPAGPTCLVVDVRLPGLSGLDFQAELARRDIERPIIFITGHGDIPMTVRAMKAGAVEFLTKPVREQDLLEVIRVALDRDRERRQSENELSGLRTRFESLTARERDVVALVTRGLLNKQAAAELGVSEVMVKVHRHNAIKKLGAKSLADLVRMADVLGVTVRRDVHQTWV
jgi:FixJ family two-component response regulator